MAFMRRILTAATPGPREAASTERTVREAPVRMRMPEWTDTISVGDAPPAQGWSQRELFEIGRVRAASERCLLELVGGQSDEGDPWCIVCDGEGERVLL